MLYEPLKRETGVRTCDRENSRAYAYNTKGEILAVVQGGFWRISSCWSDNKYVYFAEGAGGLSIMDIDSFEIVAQFGYPYLSMLGCHGICGNSKGDIFICSIDAVRRRSCLWAEKGRVVQNIILGELLGDC